jgi:hypothetical protein
MNRFYNKFLIVLVGVILFGGLYIYFSNGLKSEAADSSLSSSQGAAASSAVTTDQKIIDDTAFIATLSTLNTIKIDTSLFSDASFTSLNDNNVQIEIGDVGRSNPFALMSVDNTKGTTSTPAVVTNNATQVTDITAILSGTVNGSNATSVYFEYGTISDALDKKTTPVKQSLIGGFVTNINGLSTKTSYYFRAAAKVNGTVLYGDVVSFTTK